MGTGQVAYSDKGGRRICRNKNNKFMKKIKVEEY
jgi:hypothetical protein